MEPMGESTTRRQSRPPLSRRRLLIIGGVLAAVVVVIVVIVAVVTWGDDRPDRAEAAEIMVNAIAAAGTTEAGQPAERFNTSGLRAGLERDLPGWSVRLAVAEQGRRVGVAARPVDGAVCVLAWSDVGAPRSATVDDPNLPCDAEIALVPAGGVQTTGPARLLTSGHAGTGFAGPLRPQGCAHGPMGATSER